jgi:DHA1 family bicyclomycin/chloramphenicol resistance-like MFS transporter
MSMALAPLALDTYLPAFPAMADSFGVNVHEISLSISIYVFMLALGQLVGGPLSDRYGRGLIMLSGLSLFTITSLLISQTTSLTTLLILRALQAFGGGWAMVCVPAIVRDKLSGIEAAKFFSLIGLIMIIAPAIAPAIGSLLLHFSSWVSIFLFLGIYSIVLAILLKLVIFRGQAPTSTAVPISIWQRYRSVFSTRAAMPFMFLQMLAFSVMMLFITHSSFIYQEHFGVGPAVFSLLFGVNVVMMLVMNLTNRALLKRSVAPETILRAGLTMQGVGVVLLLLVVTLAPSLWLFVPAMVITVGALGAVGPNIQACFMEYFPQNSGTAAALIGATQFLFAGLVSALSILLPETLLSIVLCQAACSAMCLLLVWRKRQV